MTALYENIKRACRMKRMTVFDLEKAADALQTTVDELLKEER